MVHVKDSEEQQSPQMEPKSPQTGPGSPISSDGESGYFDTKLTISSDTARQDMEMLAKMVRDAAGLDEGADGLDPTAHVIEVRFTARETSSIDVYDAFGDWLQDLSEFVKTQVAAARPQKAVSTPKSSRPAEPSARSTIRNTASGSMEAWHSKPSSVQALPDRPARPPIAQASRARPTAPNHASRWETFFSKPPPDRRYKPTARPPTKDHVADLAKGYEDLK